jgi:sugar phosphate permease
MFSFVNACAVLGKLFMAAAFNGVYVYVVEIFPVEVRAGAMGVCNVAARVGGMFAPVIAELNVSVASTIFGLLALGAALATARVLPETRGRGEGEGSVDSMNSVGAAFSVRVTTNSQ